MTLSNHTENQKICVFEKSTKRYAFRLMTGPITPRHSSFVETTNLQVNLEESLLQNRYSSCLLSEMETTSDRKVHSANPPLSGESPFYIRAVIELARGPPSKMPPHSRVYLSLAWTRYVRPLFGTNM